MIRKPFFAGKFYEKDKTLLYNQLLELVSEVKKDFNNKIKAMIIPHAGYVFSGKIAGLAYSYINKKIYDNPVFVILSPNHTGNGSPVSISSHKAWNTPLGDIPVNNELRDFLCEDPNFMSETDAHLYEHSIEVQLPFLQYIFKESPFSILPITLGINNINDLEYVYNNIKKSVEKYKGDVIFIASSDFSHYIPKEEAYSKDNKAIDKIIKNTPLDFYDHVRKNNLSICGSSAIFLLMRLFQNNTDIEKKLLKYTTSGDIMPMKEVVGYASIIFY